MSQANTGLFRDFDSLRPAALLAAYWLPPAPAPAATTNSIATTPDSETLPGNVSLSSESQPEDSDESTRFTKAGFVTYLSVEVDPLASDVQVCVCEGQRFVCDCKILTLSSLLSS